MGIASTIAVARQAREQLKAGIQACETSTDAANRAIGIQAATNLQNRIHLSAPAAAPAT